MLGGGHTSLAWAEHNGEYATTRQSKVLVVIIPGLTGSSQDNYVKDLVNKFGKAKYRCVVYQPRFNGGKLVLPDEGFLDILKDFKLTIEYLKQKEAGVKLVGIGHSYGANLLVNYLGTYSTDSGFLAGVSIANPYNLMLGENKLRGSPVDRAITGFLQKTASKSKKELEEAIRFKLNLEELFFFKSVRDFDRNFTIKVYGFETVDDYYWGISSCRRMRSVKVPLFMLQAEDDPVVEANAFLKEEIEKSNPNVLLKMTSRGGHQGWIEGFFSLRRWYLQPVFEYVDAVVEISDI